MGCIVGKSHPMTLEQSAIALGGVAAVFNPKVTREQLDEVLPGAGEKTFMCGDGLPSQEESVCRCGYFADFLCDWPVGKGKTCDLVLCQKCAHEIGEDKHACEIHWHEFQSKTGVQRMFPFEPKIVR